MNNKITHLAMRLLVLASALFLSACATVANPNPKDPWEAFNRPVFNVNKSIDEAIIKPVAQSYSDYVPEPLRDIVSNVFSNMGDTYSAVNSLLQGKPVDAIESVLRVGMNTVLGFGGIIDFATPAGLPKRKEDFGQTLGTWGVPSGPYLVLPIFGPSSARDSVGFVVDFFMTPVSYLQPFSLSASVSTLFIVQERAKLLNTTNLLGEVAFDEYSFVRDGYLQRRQYLIYDGNPPEEDPPPNPPADTTEKK